MLKIEKLTVTYKKEPVINELSYTFSDGKHYALTGPSGIGKTSLINVLSGLKKQTSGKVISTYKAPTYIFQEPRLFPWLTALENINIVCNDMERSRYLLKHFIDDKDVEGKYPHELSGGMKQRVAIARALSYESDIVFMDEPFEGLDEEMRQEVRSFVFEQLKGKTVIMITHNMDDASLCDIVLKMDGIPVSQLVTEESGNINCE